jgi:hypothetical protein
MKNVWLIVALCADCLSAEAQLPSKSAVVAEKGQTIISANDSRLGAVYRVDPDGSPEIIVDGRMIKIPMSTLAMKDGKLTTTLTKKEALALH